MKDKIIRLLKAIGIALLCFGGSFLFVWGFSCHAYIASIIMLVGIFIFVVCWIYTEADL